MNHNGAFDAKKDEVPAMDFSSSQRKYLPPSGSVKLPADRFADLMTQKSILLHRPASQGLES